MDELTDSELALSRACCECTDSYHPTGHFQSIRKIWDPKLNVSSKPNRVRPTELPSAGRGRSRQPHLTPFSWPRPLPPAPPGRGWPCQSDCPRQESHIASVGVTRTRALTTALESYALPTELQKVCTYLPNCALESL